MKRRQGNKDGGTKKVRFAEVESEIMPEIEAEEPVDCTSSLPRQTDEETEWLADVRDGEIPFATPGDMNEGEVPLEPFNLDEEREFGTFGEDGFYVESKTSKSEIRDAWLSSSEAAVCSIDVLRKHEQQQQAMAEAEKTPKAGISHIIDLQTKIVAKLKPRETVLMALRRMGRKKKTKDDPERDMQGFEQLTELADTLLNCGETDVYSMYKEEFEHSVQSLGYGKKETETANPGTDDMFAAESDDERDKNELNSASETKTADKGPVKDDGTESGVQSDVVEAQFSAWPIAELKRFLRERHVDCSSVVEKGELIEKAREVHRSNKQRAASYQAPEGFVYHSESGYFYNHDRGLYYDGATQCFYDPNQQKWFDRNWNPLQQS